MNPVLSCYRVDYVFLACGIWLHSPLFYPFLLCYPGMRISWFHVVAFSFLIRSEDRVKDSSYPPIKLQLLVPTHSASGNVVQLSRSRLSGFLYGDRIV